MTLPEISKLIPHFLAEDKNGYAMAKAIEAGLKHFVKTIQDGLDCVVDVEKMPEWRLDEMAWELGCLYDHNADIKKKRAWILNSIPNYASYGTVEAIYKFLDGYFDGIEVEEWWQYGAEPYHFRVTTDGEWTNENEKWARNAIARIKNVRSLLDDLTPGSHADIYVRGETFYIKFPYLMADGSPTGTTPEIAYAGKVTEGDIHASGKDSGSYVFPYVMAGTTPEIAYTGKIAEGAVTASGEESQGYKFPYTMTGTTPQEAYVGAVANGSITASNETQGYRFDYEMPSEDVLTGTGDTENTGFAQATSAAETQSEGEGTVFSYEPTSEESLCGDDDAL